MTSLFEGVNVQKVHGHDWERQWVQVEVLVDQVQKGIKVSCSVSIGSD